MEKEQLEHGIFIYKNILLESKSMIEEIEFSVQNNVSNWTKSMVRTGEGISENTMIRDTDTIGVPYLGKIDEEFNNVPEAFYKTLNNMFYEAFDPCEKDYKAMFGIDTEWHDTYGILKYGEGQFFNNHVDDNVAYHRRISTVYYMNDDYEGGEINFPRYQISYKPKAHELLVFPSFYTYNHSVNPVISGTRYAVVSWLR
jgi:Rps23 Pro-64 3,4-dihydroxylase Tpa1-like proline 4-hydroxylase